MRAGRTLLPAVMLALLAGASGCSAEGGETDMSSRAGGAGSEVRRPVVAGTFYPADREQLARDIDGYLSADELPELEGTPMALIVPHAGYVYSGGVAGRAYAFIRELGFDTAVVVAPSHRLAFGTASVYGGDGYETPLGVVPVDRELADAIAGDSEALSYEPRAHSGEHSLEVQVPFLQRALKDFSIVPIVMGDQRESSVRTLAGRLAQAVRNSGGKRVLLVASSDLSHYHTQSEAEELDGRVVSAVGDFDPEGLLGLLARGESEACGGGPAAAVMMAARELGAARSTVVGYATSGDVTGDRSQVVGYMAAVITGPVPKRSEGDLSRSAEDRGAVDGSGSEPATGGHPYEGLTADERTVLLSLARRSVEAALEGKSAPSPEKLTAALATECGAFVTLEKDGALRGCIGYVRAYRPLAQTVSEMAVQAALHDPRFPAVTAAELKDITIEISVLSPLVEVDDVSKIEVGRHGLVIQDGGRSGLLLPQVASDYGWDRETFLEHTCMKAGLPPDAWRQEGVNILMFTADVFGER